MRQKFNKHATDDFFNQHQVNMIPKKLNLHGTVHLEIGSGKGKFITDMAKDFPSETFIALEINRHVAYYIALKKEALKLDNLHIIISSVDHLLEFIDEDTVDHVYLNFSDPWPKAKHHKRRLSYPIYLSLYKKIMKPHATLEMRTDHQALYIASSFYMQEAFAKVEFDDDANPFQYYSEYEMKKRPHGPIYYIKASVNNELL
jgi:tRNA (guanine-N7-)-methyltransferase